MIVFKEAATLAKYIRRLKQEEHSVGFVPTMGALHAGHLSLIEKSKKSCSITVSSIFVNPTQFNNQNDFEKYPNTIGRDLLLLEKMGCDILLLPTVSEIYPLGTTITERYDLGELEWLLEGKFRPGHFQGVCQVVDRLLKIVQPHKLFLGQKDYQQCMIVRRLVELLDLKISVITGETFRELSGLAMSSRNLRLSDSEKQIATVISVMLNYIKEKIATTPPFELENFATNRLLEAGFTRVDYVAIADLETLQPVRTTLADQPLIALIAASIGDIRLIDNMIINE